MVALPSSGGIGSGWSVQTLEASVKSLTQSLEAEVRRSAAVVDEEKQWKSQRGGVLRTKNMPKWAREEHKDAVSALLRGEAPPEQ